MSFNKYFLLALSSNREESVLNTCASNSSQKQFYLTERNTPRGLETSLMFSSFRLWDPGVKKEFWTSNVKAAKVDTAMELRNEVERDFAEISAEYAAKEATYADKIDLINWRLARKAQSLEQNVMARRVLAYLNAHADPELESDVGDEIPDSTEVLTDLGSGVESD